MRYYIIAGEASGDLHASNLVKEIKKTDSSAVFRGFGGDLMAAEGVEIVKHYRDLAFMGFIEVLANLKTIFSNLRLSKSDILNFKADTVILVDYPGFNLRIAEFSHLQKIKTVYYISPQVWAWKKSRIKNIKRDVDLMLTILPFEEEFYHQYGFSVQFTGHPLLDAIEHRNKISRSQFIEQNNLPDKPIVALLPGSRKQEIKKMLDIMLSVTKNFSNHQFIIGMAPSIPLSFYQQIIKDEPVTLVNNQTYSLLENSEAALVTSGTASLETALFNVPEAICYKGNMISYFIARLLVKIKYIGLPNLIMDKPVVKELIQMSMNVKNLERELHALLFDQNYRSDIFRDYDLLKIKLGGPGASARAAKQIIGLIAPKIKSNV